MDKSEIKRKKKWWFIASTILFAVAVGCFIGIIFVWDNIWAQQGFIHTTEGNVIHYGYIEEFIDELGKKFNMKEIAFDRWGTVQMTQNLDNLGFTVVPFGQGFKDMSPATKELMNLVLSKNICHNGQPVLR